ncbi:hypothetical protein C8F04DRAFT_1115284 [Mycena alexandri]|uniref:F-box domain-containing protein n=1 Tax=Mycena alexandri TaxID=1745969 RepID=A0AAD6WYF0_9AGAR|nr:hypothetical protein C8F04DRAFT_1115284 [Mycena alexandri]
MSLTLPAHSVTRKSSGFLKFWKTLSRPAIAPEPEIQIPESDLILPTEIWLEVLGLLPGYTLDALSRVSKRLRWIVLPLYFRSQQIFPFMETFAFRRRNMSAELAGYQDRSLQRLKFLRSDRLIHVVKDLFISPYPPGYNRRHRVKHTPVETVMHQLLSALPQFDNLTKLVLRFPHCEDTLFSALGSLHLDSFELEVLPASLGSIPIPTRREFIFNPSSSPVQVFPSGKLSLRLLFPESLQAVVAGPTGTDTVTRALISTSSGFPALTTLDMSLRFAGCPQFSQTLQACPNLSSLRLRSSVIDGSTVPALLPPLPPTIVPHLTCYHGPAVFAPIFARGRALRHVRLWSSHSVSAVTAPWLLQPILLQLNPTIESLELGVTLVPDALLETIRDAFPALTTLSINAHLDSFHPGSVERRTLPDDIPPHTVRLALPRDLRLRTLRLGAQLEGALTAPAQICDSARDAVRAFPEGYDPTSWRRWVVDRPWYCIVWTHTGNSEGEFGRALDGTLRVEYGDHYFESFERGQRISSRTVEEAVQRMA